MIVNLITQRKFIQFFYPYAAFLFTNEGAMILNNSFLIISIINGIDYEKEKIKQDLFNCIDRNCFRMKNMGTSNNNKICLIVTQSCLVLENGCLTSFVLSFP